MTAKRLKGSILCAGSKSCHVARPKEPLLAPKQMDRNWSCRFSGTLSWDFTSWWFFHQLLWKNMRARQIGWFSSPIFGVKIKHICRSPFLKGFFWVEREKKTTWTRDRYKTNSKQHETITKIYGTFFGFEIKHQNVTNVYNLYDGSIYKW